MAEGFKSLLIAMVLVGLFAFSMIGFGVQLASENDLNQSVLDNPALESAYPDINETLGDIHTQSGSGKTSIESESPQSEGDNFLFFSIIGTGKVFLNSVVGIGNLISNVARQVLGIPMIVMNVIIAILGISLLLYFWRLVRSGE